MELVRTRKRASRIYLFRIKILIIVLQIEDKIDFRMISLQFKYKKIVTHVYETYTHLHFTLYLTLLLRVGVLRWYSEPRM